MGEIVELKKSAIKEVLEEFLELAKNNELKSLFIMADTPTGQTRLGMAKTNLSDLCYAAKVLDKIIMDEISGSYTTEE